MNGMPVHVNPPQQSPHHQMNMPPLQNMNPINSGPNMMNNNNNPNLSNPINSNNSNNGPPVTANNNNNNNSPTTPLHGPNHSNNNLPGSNNGPTNLGNPANTNSSNMNNPNNHQMMHPGSMGGNMGNMGPNMGQGMGQNMGGPMMGNNPNNMGGMPGSGQMSMFPGHKPMPVSAGKVYPADTPMVFNPQNPNAPPIYPCGVCHKEVHDNDQGLLCESGCNFWFHR
jgi:hypothetical protein